MEVGRGKERAAAFELSDKGMLVLPGMVWEFKVSEV